MADYGFKHNGKVFTPNGSTVSLVENEARNAALEKTELDEWKTQPQNACAYVVGWEIRTWLGTTLGRIVSRHSWTNNFGARIEWIKAEGTNGATYSGRYGSDWAQLVRLRKVANLGASSNRRMKW